MKTKQVIKNSITVFILLITLSYTGLAQKTDNEVAKNAVWEVQATSVAETFGLKGKEVSKFSKAYVQIREDVAEQNKKLDKKTDPDAYAANSKKNESKGAEEIKKEIDKILKGEQAEDAFLMLGSFNSRWDSYQQVILGFTLSEEKLADASNSLTEYMKLYLKARKIATDAGDRFSGRTATELKTNLDNSLKESLSESQIEEWNVATQRKAKSN